MQSFYAECFERDMGCTLGDWLGWLPRAMGECPWQVSGESLLGQVAAGYVHIIWKEAEPRRLGLAVIPRLWVRFSFSQVPEADRFAFMKRFDLYTHRGGG
jgi:hypothetical protein